MSNAPAKVDRGDEVQERLRTRRVRRVGARNIATPVPIKIHFELSTTAGGLL